MSRTGALAGSGAGNTMTLTHVGTKQHAEKGACKFTINVTLQATLTGNALNGSSRDTAKTNASPDCSLALDGCQATQSLVGSRPPR